MKKKKLKNNQFIKLAKKLFPLNKNLTGKGNLGLEPLISLLFVINILKKKDLINWRSCVDKKPYFFKIDPRIATDIDTQYNFDFCKTKFNNLKKYRLDIF